MFKLNLFKNRNTLTYEESKNKNHFININNMHAYFYKTPGGIHNVPISCSPCSSNLVG